MQRTPARTFGVALGAMLMLATADLDAQLCAGFPDTGRRGALALSAGFPAGAASLGVTANVRLPNSLALFGGYTHTEWTDDALEGAAGFDTFGGGLAYELPARHDSLAGVPVRYSLCPVASTTYTDVGGFRVLTVPLGFGLAARAPLAEGRGSVMPYVLPQVIFQTFSFRAEDPRFRGAGTSGSETSLGLEAGLRAAWGRLYGGVAGNVVRFDDGADSALKLTAGVVF